MNKKLLVFTIFFTIALSYSLGYAIIEIIQNPDLIDETNLIKIPYGANLTKNTEFIVCSTTDFINCETDTIEFKYNYSYSDTNVIGDLSKIGDLFNIYGLDISTQNIYCAQITGVSNGTTTLNASCTEKTNGNTDIDSEIFNITFGNITIHESTLNSMYNNYAFSVLPGENITLALYLKDVDGNSISTTTGDIYYTVRDITTGDVITANSITYALKKMKEQEIWIENFTIPPNMPVGIIDFSAKDTETNDFGGRYIYYTTIPFSSKLILNETNIDMGDSVFINLTNVIYYGDISEINTSIKYPNGTIEKVSLNSGNNYDYVFKTPTTQQGKYNVSILLKHKSGYTKFISKTFIVNVHTIDIAILKTIYTQGEYVDISVAVLDSGKTIPSEINFTFFDPDNKKIKSYTNSETVVENNYHEVSYKLPFDALNGTYSVEVIVKDEYNITYSKTKNFTVGNSLDYTLIDYTPESYEINVTTLNKIIKRINITNLGSPINEINMSIINQTNYISLDVENMNQTLATGDKTYFYFEIIPKDDMPLGVITSTIKINVSDERYEIPIKLNVSLFGNIKLLDDIAVEIIAEELNTIKIPVKNTGLYVLNNLDIKVENKVFEELVLDVFYPEIHTNETDTIEMDLDEMESGFYNTSVEITNDNITKIMNLNITIFDDFLTKINDLDDLRKSLHEDMISLQQDGVFIGSSLEEDIKTLQAQVNDLKDYYDFGNYSGAKKLLDNLETDAEEIQMTIISLQEAQIPDTNDDYDNSSDNTYDDGICDAGESCYDSDCSDEPHCPQTSPSEDSSGMLFVIIFVILLVVGGVIIATSVVPDDWIDKKQGSI